MTNCKQSNARKQGGARPCRGCRQLTANRGGWCTGCLNKKVVKPCQG